MRGLKLMNSASTRYSVDAGAMGVAILAGRVKDAGMSSRGKWPSAAATAVAIIFLIWYSMKLSPLTVTRTKGGASLCPAATAGSAAMNELTFLACFTPTRSASSRALSQ